jgi:Uma2 family endonuclease
MVAELVKGALYLHPRPASRHARATFRLAMKLGDPYDDGIGGPGGWYVAIEPELHLGEDVLVPDLAGWRRERMGEYPDVPAIEMSPDWICEILSSGTRRFDLTEKRARYAEAGVPHLRLIDPQAGTLEAFELGGSGWALRAAIGGEDDVRVPPFEATGFPLSALWP